jgi:hypothetical protein
MSVSVEVVGCNESAGPGPGHHTGVEHRGRNLLPLSRRCSALYATRPVGKIAQVSAQAGIVFGRRRNPREGAAASSALAGLAVPLGGVKHAKRLQSPLSE